MIQNILFIFLFYLQNRNRLTGIENNVMLTKGERWGEGEISSLKLIYTHHYI